MNQPILIERFADNGEHSHWDLIRQEDGYTLWSEEEIEMEKPVVKTAACYSCPFHCRDEVGGVMQWSCKALGNYVLARGEDEIDKMSMFKPHQKCPLKKTRTGIVELIDSKVYPNWSK